MSIRSSVSFSCSSVFCRVFLLIFTLNSICSAASLKGEITFLKKPPYSGIVYVLGGANKVSQPATVDQKGKAFTKRVIPSTTGQSITFNNSDDVDHNIFAQDKDSGAKFDIGLMTPGNSSSVEVNWSEASLVRIGCKIHPKMRAYIANIPSDHYQVFEFRDNEPPYILSIKDIPASAKELVVVLPNYDEVTVMLGGGENIVLPLTKKGSAKGEITINYSE